LLALFILWSAAVEPNRDRVLSWTVLFIACAGTLLFLTTLYNNFIHFDEYLATQGYWHTFTHGQIVFVSIGLSFFFGLTVLSTGMLLKRASEKRKNDTH
jgi:hypothetical protein